MSSIGSAQMGHNGLEGITDVFERESDWVGDLLVAFDLLSLVVVGDSVDPKSQDFRKLLHFFHLDMVGLAFLEVRAQLVVSLESNYYFLFSAYSIRQCHRDRFSYIPEERPLVSPGPLDSVFF